LIPASGLLREHPYLTKWEDNCGNFYTFEYGSDRASSDYGELRRVKSSNGNFLGFVYDTFGHITEAYTGDGRRVYYTYDEQGDLRSVLRPDGSEYRYEYETKNQLINGNNERYSTHLLTREIKPEGRVLENTYDGDRRVVEQRATVGEDLVPVRNATFTYNSTQETDDSWTGHTLITDAYDRDTRFDYSHSLITKITDAKSQDITQVWYLPGDNTPGAYPNSIKSRTDKRGMLTEFTYDADGNVLTETVTGDITGDGVSDTAVTTTVYNGLSMPESVEDPVGNLTKLFYENSEYPYLVTRIEKWTPNGEISETVQAYEAVVNGTAYSSAAPPIPTTRGAYGLLKSQTRAQGTADEALTTWTHDDRGFVTSETRYTGTSDPNVITNFIYNLRGELTQKVDAANRRTNFAYDGLGNRIWEESRNASGGLVSWAYQYYNLNGELEWEDGPGFAPEDYVWHRYNGAGRPLEVIKWRSRAKADGNGVEAETGDALYATTFFRHNRFGDMTSVVDARKNRTEMEYDQIGQMRFRRQYDGPEVVSGNLLSQEEFTYEPGGKVYQYTNVLGGVTTSFYTATGQSRRVEYPDDSVSEWRYYLDGRLAREIYSNGSYQDVVYDDDARTVSRTLRASGGGALATSSEAYDRRGNLVSATDREGYTTVTVYDDLDRPKSVTGPVATTRSAQQTQTSIYDAAGVVQRVVNGLNEESRTTFDAIGRPELVEVRDASNNVVSRTAYSYTTNHYGRTTTSGSTPHAISSTSFADTTGNPVLRKNGDDTFVLSRFDAMGNLLSVRDETTRVTSYAYNALNQRVTETLPDETVIQYNYDDAGNMTDRDMPGGLSWDASYDSSGRMQSQSLTGGSTTQRTYDYTYYDNTSPWVGKLETLTDPRGIIHTTEYDDFLRPETVTADGSQPAHDVTLDYTYDDRGILLSVSQTYSNSSVGPVTLLEQDTDGYGQVIEERVYQGSALTRQFAQHWNAAGRRTGLNLGGGITAQGSGAGTQTSFGYRADGLLTSTTTGGHTFQFGYLDNSLLDQRVNPYRTLNVTLRDARGRLREQAQNVNSASVLAEVLTWNDDSRLDTYTADRTGTGTWDEARGFGYNDRFLTSEAHQPASGVTEAIGYQFDGNGLGVRTSALSGQSGGYSVQGTDISSLARTEEESLNWITRSFTATGNAFGADHVKLWLNGTLPLGPVQFGGWTDEPGNWGANLSLNPGTYALNGTAYHPQGTFTDTAASSFTLTPQAETLTSAYDDEGNLTSRSYASQGRTQAFTWDALGRLLSVTDRNGSQDGYNWRAVYDPLGRRLETAFAPVDNNVELTGQAYTVGSWYDPQVEFLEVAVEAQGKRFWKVYGPDQSGGYGGSQGIGGLEAVLRESDGADTGVLNDFFGHAVAWSDGTVASWNPVRSGGYGPLPGTSALPLELTDSPAETLAWQGRRLDPTGLYWLGARYYDPLGGRFISPDPFGHGASLDLYAYANGDPINFYDPDGRWAKEWATSGDQDLLHFWEGFKGAGEGVGESAFYLYDGMVNDPFNTLADIGDGVYTMFDDVGDYYGSVSMDPGMMGRHVADEANFYANNPDEFSRGMGALTYNAEALLATQASFQMGSAGFAKLSNPMQILDDLGMINKSVSGTSLPKPAAPNPLGANNPYLDGLIKPLPTPATTPLRPGRKGKLAVREQNQELAEYITETTGLKHRAGFPLPERRVPIPGKVTPSGKPGYGYPDLIHSDGNLTVYTSTYTTNPAGGMTPLEAKQAMEYIKAMQPGDIFLAIPKVQP
jgi:RHS repeat-associated protein